MTSPLLSDIKRFFRESYGNRLSQLVLYGSQARGDAVPGSDIDLLIVLKGTVDPVAESDRVLDRVVNWNLETGELVSCLFMDEEQFLTRNGPLLRNIRREGVAL